MGRRHLPGDVEQLDQVLELGDVEQLDEVHSRTPTGYAVADHSEESMATLRDDWTMPPAPAPGAVATYYLDGNEMYLGWTDTETGEPAGGDDDCDIPWPFVEDSALRSEVVAAGFVDAEGL